VFANPEWQTLECGSSRSPTKSPMPPSQHLHAHTSPFTAAASTATPSLRHQTKAMAIMARSPDSSSSCYSPVMEKDDSETSSDELQARVNQMEHELSCLRRTIVEQRRPHQHGQVKHASTADSTMRLAEATSLKDAVMSTGTPPASEASDSGLSPSLRSGLDSWDDDGSWRCRWYLRRACYACT
jgi:hypothetical protein